MLNFTKNEEYANNSKFSLQLMQNKSKVIIEKLKKEHLSYT
jgi:hypothetical protein